MIQLSQKSRIRLRAAWAQWSPAAVAGLVSAGLVFALVRLLTSTP